MLDTLKSSIVMLIVVDFEPAELFAQIVYTAPLITWVGVPQIVPLLVSNVNPVGSVALIAQDEILPVVRVGRNGWCDRSYCNSICSEDVIVGNVSRHTSHMKCERGSSSRPKSDCS